MIFKQAVEDFATKHNLQYEDVEGLAWQIEKIVKDDKTNDIKNVKFTHIGKLEWSECLGGMNWYDATKKCEELGGELPTRVELLDLCDNHKDECKDFADGNYWSSTESSVTYAWKQYFTTGNQYASTKTNSFYVRCVRKA